MNWDDGYWYVAKIGTIEGNKYRLEYYDGDVDTVLKNKIQKINADLAKFKVGEAVEYYWPHSYEYIEGMGQIWRRQAQVGALVLSRKSKAKRLSILYVNSTVKIWTGYLPTGFASPSLPI